MGILLIQGSVTKSIFNEVLEKIHVRLTSWKGQLLNRAGRVCLTKYVMASLLIYNMQTMWFPMEICDKIDQLSCGFIWMGNEDFRSLNLVNWEIVTLPRKYGGLAIRRAQETNVSLLGKVIWRLLVA